MSKDTVKMIESEFIQTWEEKNQRKKRQFMDDMINEKEILEKCVFLSLDIEEDDLGKLSFEKKSLNSEMSLDRKSLLSKGIDFSKHSR